MRTIRSIGIALAAAVGVVAISAGSASATRVEAPTPPKPRCNDISLNTGHLPGGRDIKDLKDPYAHDFDLWSQGLFSTWTADGQKGLVGTGKNAAGASKATDKGKSGVKRKWRHAVGGPVKVHHGAPVEPNPFQR